MERNAHGGVWLTASRKSEDRAAELIQGDLRRYIRTDARLPLASVVLTITI